MRCLRFTSVIPVWPNSTVSLSVNSILSSFEKPSPQHCNATRPGANLGCRGGLGLLASVNHLAQSSFVFSAPAGITLICH